MGSGFSKGSFAFAVFCLTLSARAAILPEPVPLPRPRVPIEDPSQVARIEAISGVRELDPETVLSWIPSAGHAAAEAKALGLGETYARLQIRAQKEGLTPAMRAALKAYQVLVSPRTPIGFPEQGAPVWLPNFDLTYSNVQRSLSFRLGASSILKVKGSGTDQRASISPLKKKMVVPIEIPQEPFGRSRTWRIHFSLPHSDGRTELANLLRAHELFERVWNRPAPFPIPVELTFVHSAEVGGKTVSLSQLWSDPRYYQQASARYHTQSQGLLKMAQVLVGSELEKRLERWRTETMDHVDRFLVEHGVSLEGLTDDGRLHAYVNYQLAEAILEREPMSQLSLIERAPVRNVIPGTTEAYYDYGNVPVSEFLRSYGQPPLSEVPHTGDMRDAVEWYYSHHESLARVLERASREAGQSYGFFVGIDAKIENSMEGKDMVGGQPTDFLDMGIPDTLSPFFNYREGYWPPVIDQPAQLIVLLDPLSALPEFGAFPLKPDFERAKRIFLASARKSFYLTVQSLLIEGRARGLLSDDYRRSLLDYFREQRDKPKPKSPSEGEAWFRKAFLPVLKRLALDV